MFNEEIYYNCNFSKADVCECCNIITDDERAHIVALVYKKFCGCDIEAGNKR